MTERSPRVCLLAGCPAGGPGGHAESALEIFDPGGLGPRLQGDSPAARRHFPVGARLRQSPGPKIAGGPPVR